MTNVRRIYVEKRKEYATEAHEIQTNLVEQLGLTIHSLRIVHRYDVQGILSLIHISEPTRPY